MNTAPPSVPPVAAPLHCEQCDCRNDLAFRFEFAFQPIVDVAARRIFAQEALVRGPDGEASGSVLSQVNDDNRYRFAQSSRVKAVKGAKRLCID